MDAAAAFAQLPPGEQQVWQSIYGQAAPFIWAQQSGMYQAPTASQQGFNALPYDQQATWYGTYGGAAPSVWQQQASAAGAPTGGAGNPVTGGYGGPYAGGSTVPSTNPWSIGAGTSSVPYGYGVPGFGQPQMTIRPEYLPYLQSMTTGERGGYIPGSGTFNQWNLSQPGLVGTVGGVANSNLRYGQGGTGDPTTGREPQTPEEWLSGPRAFAWEGNMGQTAATQGLDYIANLFGRPDAGSSGIATSAWSAPQQYWQGLAQAVQSGTVKASPFGLKALAAKGFNVSPPGGAVDLGASGRTVGGAGGTGGQGGDPTQNALASIAASNAADQAARQAYAEWQMRTGDETLAMQKAQQAWSQTFQEHQQQYTQGVTDAGLTGQYNGQQTQAAQQQAWSQGFQERGQQQSGALSLLSQQSALQGPRDWQKYWQLSASAPQGLTSALSSLAGQYGFAPGGQGTPGPATLQTRTQDLLSGGNLGTAGAAQGDTSAGGGAGQTGGLPNPWQINLQNYSRMSPSMQQGVLGGYEGAGYYGPDIEQLLKQSAPRYTGPSSATVTA